MDELVLVLQSLGVDTADKDASDMMKEADLNGDGVISFEGICVLLQMSLWTLSLLPYGVVCQ